MMRTGLLSLLLTSVLSFLLVGCATSKSSGSVELAEEGTFSQTALAVTAKLRFADVPAPAGFKLLREKSFVFQTEATRVALLKYSGRAKLQDLIEFYQQQMPLYNWQLLNVVEYEKSILNFERRDQTCIITIESRGTKKLLTISVAPRAKGSIETEGQKTE